MWRERMLSYGWTYNRRQRKSADESTRVSHRIHIDCRNYRTDKSLSFVALFSLLCHFVPFSSWNWTKPANFVCTIIAEMGPDLISIDAKFCVWFLFMRTLCGWVFYCDNAHLVGEWSRLGDGRSEKNKVPKNCRVRHSINAIISGNILLYHSYKIGSDRIGIK